MIVLLAATACNSSPTAQNTEKESPGVETSVDPWVADSIAYNYWGSPASPYRDEDRYIQFLDILLASDSLPEPLRDRALYRRRIAMLNRPGTLAADISYLERHGHESRLYNLESPLTLLIFYDPECPHCGDILQSITTSGTINRAVAEKSLTVIAIYAEGKRDIWDKTRGDMPANWLVGYDLTAILDNELYDLPAMPTLYLLDQDKTVLLKDPPHTTLLPYLKTRLPH